MSGQCSEEVFLAACDAYMDRPEVLEQRVGWNVRLVAYSVALLFMRLGQYGVELGLGSPVAFAVSGDLCVQVTGPLVPDHRSAACAAEGRPQAVIGLLDYGQYDGGLGGGWKARGATRSHSFSSADGIVLLPASLLEYLEGRESSPVRPSQEERALGVTFPDPWLSEGGRLGCLLLTGKRNYGTLGSRG